MTKRNPALRVKDDDLNSTGIPTPFVVDYFAYFNDCRKAEKKAHEKLWSFHHGKEFFKVDVITAITAIESIPIPYVRLFSKPDIDKIKQEEAAKRKKEVEEMAAKRAEEEAKRAEEERRRKVREEEEKRQTGLKEKRMKILNQQLAEIEERKAKELEERRSAKALKNKGKGLFRRIFR